MHFLELPTWSCCCPWQQQQFAEQTRQKIILTIKRMDHLSLLAAFAHLVILGALTVRIVAGQKAAVVEVVYLLSSRPN
jgi:hypothetical protein